MSLSNHPKRADQLQFLRFLAYCLIFIHHIEWPIFGKPTSNGSGLAVSFFFILGGFVSAYSRFGKEEPLRWYSPFTYLWKKYKKVWPLHLLTFGIALLVSNVPAAYTAQNQPWLQPQLTALWQNVLLIHSWFNGNYFYFNGVSWFLSSIMFSYLLTVPVSALFNWLNRKKGHIPLFSLLVLLFAGCSFGWCYYSANMDTSFYQYIHPMARSLEYLAGMALCHLVLSVRGYIRDGKAVKAIFTVLEVAALAFWISYIFIDCRLTWAIFSARFIPANVALLAVFGFGFGYVSRFFSLRPLRRLGDVSFECFITHQMVITIYLLFNAKIVTPGIRERLFCAIVCFAITLGMAFYINREPKKT